MDSYNGGMQATQPLARPMPLSELPAPLLESHREVAALAHLAAAGLPLGSVVVVPAQVEERFYRLNNLPERLTRLFAAVDPTNPDEDDVEEAAPEAERLVRQHYLLDEFIDDFYRATAALPDRLRVRRPLEAGGSALRGRPALMALKRTYQRDWGYDAVWERLSVHGAIALEARPVLLHDDAEGTPSAELVARVREALGPGARPRVTADGRIVGIDGV